MANEKLTDRMVQQMLDAVGLDSVPNASNIKEVEEALRTASKRQTGRTGFPEFTARVKDYLLIIEDKASVAKHAKFEGADGTVALNSSAAGNYALNGAIHYGKHIAENTNFKKVFAIGVAGDEKHHTIQPAFIGSDGNYTLLPEIETLENFSLENIDGYYRTSVLHEPLPERVQQEELMIFAKKLHEDLRNYGALLEEQKPLVVSAILLALEDSDNFTVEGLVGNAIDTDGAKVYRALKNYLLGAKIPDAKRDVVLERFGFIKSGRMSEIDTRLGKTPMRYFVEQIRGKMGVAHEDHPSHDMLGRFYGEFVKYSGGDGKGLGIVLTPTHITELFCDLLDVSPRDRIFDPCCGTSGFLISAMNRMLPAATDDIARSHIKQHQLHGVELQPNMFAVATTNMILRGDGKSNLRLGDFMEMSANGLRQENYTVGMMNPPYSQAKTKDTAHLSEVSFTQHLIDSMAQGGRVAVIVPQSTLAGKTVQDRQIKKEILKKHTLESVVTLNKDTFYGVGVNAAIAIFTAYIAHPKDKKVKFFNFEDDGWELYKGGLIPNEQKIKDRKKRLLDVYRGHTVASTDFVVETTIEDDDEWLHAFYYFDDLPPTEDDFRKTMTNYLTFEFSMTTSGRGHLFDESTIPSAKANGFMKGKDEGSRQVQWKEFQLDEIFETIKRGKRLIKKKQIAGDKPYVSSSALNNGVDNFVSNSQGVREFINGLTIANSGSVGAVFYHPYKFVASDHVTFLGRADLTKYEYLFLSTALSRLGNKYAFNREMSDPRIRRERIVLPATTAAHPDWGYMRMYMQTIEQLQLQLWFHKKV